MKDVACTGVGFPKNLNSRKIHSSLVVYKFVLVISELKSMYGLKTFPEINSILSKKKMQWVGFFFWKLVNVSPHKDLRLGLFQETAPRSFSNQ